MEVREFKKLDDKLLDDIVELDGKIFSKSFPKEKFINELSSKFNTTILMIYDKDKPVAFKIGFERSNRLYYSWIGGVIPEYRGKGLAKKLMIHQHNLAKNLGYKVICTQSDNSFKDMLILNLKSGFEIKGAIQSTGDDHLTIVFEKDLTKGN